MARHNIAAGPTEKVVTTAPFHITATEVVMPLIMQRWSMKKLLMIAAAASLSDAAASAQEFRTGHNSPKRYAPNGKCLGNLNNNPYESKFDRKSIWPVWKQGSPLEAPSQMELGDVEVHGSKRQRHKNKKYW